LTNISLLKNVRAVLFDMDGVVYVGNQALPGVQDLLDYLDATGRVWSFVTNNSTRTPQMFADKVQKMGMRVGPERILTSSLVTAWWMTEEFPNRGKVYALGEAGLITALTDAGFTLVEDPFEAEFVVSGINFSLTYRMLEDATLGIRNGARFIGTNIDPTYPTERGQIPGTGSVLALLEAASGVKPTIIGKPFPGMFQQILQRLGTEAESTLMIGDRYETDIIGAIAMGFVTAAVTTGINSREEFEAVAPPPDLILSGLPELLAAFRKADGVIR
jgi:4-nitrophenyl phosphatase